MRIAMITPGFSAGPSDWAIPALQTLASALAREHELFLFSLRYPEEGHYEWDNFSHQALGGGQRYGLASINIWRKTGAAILNQHRRTPFDILHAFWADEPGLVAALAGAKIKRPVIVSIGGGELSNITEINYGTQRSYLRGRITRLSLKAAGAVTAGSAYQLKLAQQQGLDMSKAHKVPLGVDTGHFQPGTPPSWQQPAIVQAASLTPVKNQALLLETMAKIKKELPNICLFLAGDGPLRPQLENLARTFNIDDRTTFAGPIPFTGMPRFFRQGHLYLQTSRHESQGMSVLEAMACGLPVIGTPVGVTAELAAMPATANPDELAAQALKVLCEPARYESERQKARELVVEEYSLDKTVQRFVSLYHQLSRPQ